MDESEPTLAMGMSRAKVSAISRAYVAPSHGQGHFVTAQGVDGLKPSQLHNETGKYRVREQTTGTYHAVMICNRHASRSTDHKK